LLTFVDTDAMIVEEAGRSIPEIFEDEGEAGFRNRERGVLEKANGLSCHVIATGGGVILKPENRQTIRSLGYVIWLTASVDQLLFRISQSRDRPLMQTADPKQRLIELLEMRKPLYEEVSDMVVDTTDLTLCETVHGLIDCINYHFSCQA
jgi:shikimate kinase